MIAIFLLLDGCFPLVMEDMVEFWEPSRFSCQISDGVLREVGLDGCILCYIREQDRKESNFIQNISSLAFRFLTHVSLCLS